MHTARVGNGDDIMGHSFVRGSARRLDDNIRCTLFELHRGVCCNLFEILTAVCVHVPLHAVYVVHYQCHVDVRLSGIGIIKIISQEIGHAFIVQSGGDKNEKKKTYIKIEWTGMLTNHNYIMQSYSSISSRASHASHDTHMT